MAYSGRGVAGVALACVLGTGCGSSVSEPEPIDGPDFMQSPIWLSDDVGTFKFTVAAPTPVLFNNHVNARLMPSPGRTRVAQTRWLGGDGTEVYDLAGTLLGSFDASLTLVGWAGEDALVFVNQNIVGDVVRTNLDGSIRTSFDFELPIDVSPDVFRTATSRDGKYLAVSFRLDLGVLVLDTASGAIVQSYAVDDSLSPAALAWIYDGRLVIASAFGLTSMAVVSPTSSAIPQESFPGSSCSLESWTPAYPILFGTSIAMDNTPLCAGRGAMRADGTGLTPLTWLAPVSFVPGVLTFGPVYALAPDARRVVYQVYGEDAINIAHPDGSAAGVLLARPSRALALAW